MTDASHEVYWLTRIFERKKPRKDWARRWHEAGRSVNWVGVCLKNKNSSSDEMLAEIDSPIWKALASGVGGFRDALGKGTPPFAYGSGMGWVARRLQKNNVTHPVANPDLNVNKSAFAASVKKMFSRSEEYSLTIRF